MHIIIFNYVFNLYRNYCKLSRAILVAHFMYTPYALADLSFYQKQENIGVEEIRLAQDNDLDLTKTRNSGIISEKSDLGLVQQDFKEYFVIKRKGFVEIEGPDISMVFKNIPAKEALMAITKLGNYGYIYLSSSDKKKEDSSIDETLISLSFDEEKYEIVINSILMAAGLQGKKEGNILFVGENVLGKGFTPEVSKVYRMNNTSAASASDYLASLGAVINKVSLKDIGSGDSDSNDDTFNSENANYSIQSYCAYQGPLKGLTGTSDARLEAITLIGTKKLIDLAEKYLQEIDKVQKQVALSVKILDVNLDDEDNLQNSFALKLNNPTAYILNDEGEFDFAIGDITSWRTTRPKGVSNLTLNEASKFDFLNWLKGKVASKETKVLASPTLILSETRDKIIGGKGVEGTDGFGTSTIGREYGNEAFITVGTKVVTNYKVTAGSEGAPAACEPIFGVSGLTFGGKLHKINSDGFITFSLSPEISSITSTDSVGTCGLVNILSIRRLDTGSIKVKSGDTLALTGVITDTESEIFTKWPVLGEFPLIGNLFKSKSKGSKKSELIILVTPNIISDDYEFSPNINSSNLKNNNID